MDDRPQETGARGRADVHAVLRRLADVLEPRPVWCGPDDGELHDVVIAEPGDALDGLTGALVLAVGAREAEAAAMVTAAGAAGAVALAVRVDDDGLPRAVRAAAQDAGIAVVGLPRGLRWDRAEAEIRAVLAAPTGEFAPGRSGDLFSLAQTVATLTHGLVSLEDGAHRVLAYAGPVDEADELRRATILGRSCPEPYLALLRGLGVHQRVRAGDEVVTVDAQPDLGARRRLVVGVNAGRRPLGTIWVQEGDRPLADRAPQMLRGAARLAALQLVDHYFQGDAGARLASREELSHGLLTGRFDAAALAAHLGIAPAAGADIVAVDLREPAEGGDAVRADARRAEAAGIVSVHVAAHRENALVAQACGQIYAVLPTPPPSSPSASSSVPAPGSAAASAPLPSSPSPSAYESEAPLLRWADELVATLRRLTGTPVQAALAGRADRLSDVPAVKLRGHRALQLLARTPEATVGTHTRLAPALLVRDTLELLDRSPELRFPTVAALVARDREQGTDLARSLLLYLDAFGDVGAVAKRLNVHPNTLRYRVRRAVALTGLDLDDPEHRLAATLQLRLDLDARALTDPAFPGA
ncbi:PucR family transcriptional regulator [Streptomyces sp. WG-D5]